MYLLILATVSKNIIYKGRKSICVTVSLRTYMYSQLIYLHFGGRYTSFTQPEAEIHALEYKCAPNTGPFSLLFLIPKMTYYFRMFFYSHLCHGLYFLVNQLLCIFIITIYETNYFIRN